VPFQYYRKKESGSQKIYTSIFVRIKNKRSPAREDVRFILLCASTTAVCVAVDTMRGQALDVGGQNEKFRIVKTLGSIGYALSKSWRTGHAPTVHVYGKTQAPTPPFEICINYIIIITAGDRRSEG